MSSEKIHSLSEKEKELPEPPSHREAGPGLLEGSPGSHVSRCPTSSQQVVGPNSPAKSKELMSSKPNSPAKHRRGHESEYRPPACQGCPLPALHAGRPSSPGLEDEGRGVSQEAARHRTHTFLTRSLHIPSAIPFALCFCNLMMPVTQSSSLAHRKWKWDLVIGERASPRVGEEGEGVIGPFQGQGKEQPPTSWAWGFLFGAHPSKPLSPTGTQNFKALILRPFSPSLPTLSSHPHPC